MLLLSSLRDFDDDDDEDDDDEEDEDEDDSSITGLVLFLVIQTLQANLNSIFKASQ